MMGYNLKTCSRCKKRWNCAVDIAWLDPKVAYQSLDSPTIYFLGEPLIVQVETGCKCIMRARRSNIKVPKWYRRSKPKIIPIEIVFSEQFKYEARNLGDP